MTAPGLSVVVLAYDEEAALGASVDGLVGELDGLARPFELIVVDDGSRDGTLEAARKAAARHGGVRVVRHEENRGLAAAAVTGFRAAAGDFVMWVEGDGQFFPGDLAGFVERMADCDVVTSVRDRRRYSWLRRGVSWGYNALLNAAFGLSVRDAGSAIMVRRSALDGDAPSSRSVAASAELLLRCRRRGLRFGECRRTYVPRRHGRSRLFRPGQMARAAADLWRLYRARG